jgi:hypothetical protein
MGSAAIECAPEPLRDSASDTNTGSKLGIDPEILGKRRRQSLGNNQNRLARFANRGAADIKGE